jgi:starch synthase
MKNINVVIAASEAIPYSKTGGLADVTGTLFKEYSRLGLDVLMFLPLYKKTYKDFYEQIQETNVDFEINLGGIIKKCKLFVSKADKKNRVYFISNDEYFGRDELYGTSLGDFPDNNYRFIFFSKAIIETLKRLKIRPDIIHCNDWQTALIPLYIKRDELFKDIKTVITIHNLGYQGIFPPDTLEIAGIGWELFHMDGVEFYGNMNFLKAGIISADLITTVSETYSKEILTPEFGFGLDGILKKKEKDIVGILNGIDYEEWNPSKDKLLPYNYSKSNISGKFECKNELLKRCQISNGKKVPTFCFIGRLSSQKGIDLLSEAIPYIIDFGSNLIIIGKGEEFYNSLLQSQRDKYPESVFFYSGFNESLAHLAYAGADIFLMPSRYEPCGLGQMIAMRYGTIPVARRTGGLADTIEDNITGFLFNKYSLDSFLEGINRAINFYHEEQVWVRFIKNAMSKDFSWKRSAKKYIEIYKNLLSKNNSQWS